MSEAYNDALQEQLESNVWSTLKKEASSLSKLEYATLSADIVGIFDPTPASDAVGAVLSAAQGDILGVGFSLLGMIPYVGDLGKLGKIAKVAPRTAKALEAMLKHGDNLAKLGKEGLEQAFKLREVAAARKAAMDRVKQAMLDARLKTPNCEDCAKLVDESTGVKRQLQLPRDAPGKGKWNPPDGYLSGTGRFEFDSPKTLPDGTTQVSGIDYIDGQPDFSKYAHANQKYNLWEVTGDVATDEAALKRLMGDGWSPPPTRPADATTYVLHHAGDGSVMYVPRVLHDKALGGVGHTGGNSMLNNKLF